MTVTGLLTVSVACVNDSDLPEIDMSLREDTLYGLYWYGEDAYDSMKSQQNMPTEYYDPQKPTLIYSHGLKSTTEEKEVFTTLEKTISKTKGASGEYDYVVELKELGYNVAFFDWYDYAHDLDALQNEIWVVKDADSIGNKDSNYYQAVSALDGRSFAGEIVRAICAVMQKAEDKEVILVGHSFGGQMVTAVAYTLYKLADTGYITNKNVLPDRISLADPYIPGSEVSGEMDLIGEVLDPQPTAQKTADAFEYLNTKGAVIDLNGAMKGWTYDGYTMLTKIEDEALRESVDAKIKANTVYIVQKALTSAYGSIGDVHVVSRDYVLTSFIEGKKGNMSCKPLNSMSASELREYVGRQFELSGKGFPLANAVMTETE